MKKTVLLFFIFISYALYPQSEIDFIVPDEVLDSAYNYYNEGDYSKTINTIEKIHYNDSVYADALLLKVNALLDKEEYSSAIETCNYALLNNKGQNLSFLINRAVAYLRSEEYIESLRLFNEILEDYPYNSNCYYNIGLCYYYLEDYQKAITNIQQSIVYNPYFAKPHYDLGLICLNENMIAQALLCFDTYLLLEPNSSASLNILSQANNMVSSKQEPEPKDIKVSNDDEGFQEINLILNNYVALNKKYKISNKITLPFVKQNHALMEKLSEFEGGDDFWERNYVKFYKNIFEAGYFDALMYRLMSSTTNASYSKIINKENSNSDEFIAYVANLWLDIIGSNNISDGLEKDWKYYYYNSGHINTIAYKNEKGEFDGCFDFFTKEGGIMSHGCLSEDKYYGDWVFYHENGQISITGSYDNDKRDSTFKEYSDKGELLKVMNYSDGKYDGQYSVHNSHGIIEEDYNYEDGELNGKAFTYHELGKESIEYEYTFKDNKIDGLLKEYYPSGQILMEVNFVEGSREGLETRYHFNGEVETRANYVDNLADGEYVSYYNNGAIEQKGYYKKGKLTGKWEKYYINGNIETVSNYSESGKLEGEYKDYDYDGILISNFIYGQGDLKKYTYYDKNGQILISKTKSKKQFDFQGYHPNGNEYGYGKYKIEGGKIGEWIYNDVYGNLFSKEVYNDENQIMSDLEYFPNKTLYSSMNYSDGLQDGYCYYNYMNGTKYSEGFYSKGEQYRIWRYYHADGTLSNEYYYKDGKLDGLQYNYAVNGKLFSIDSYENGDHVSKILVDSFGNYIDTTFYYEDGVIRKYYSNGNKKSEIEYLNGIAHGPVTWYYPNGEIEVKGQYNNSERNGEWNWYYDDGTTSATSFYQHGNAKGKWLNYHENGKKRLERNYFDDKLNGDYKRYSEEGVMTYFCKYTFGKKHDTLFRYSEAGELQIAFLYKNDELISYSYEDSEGKLLPFKEINNKGGECISYYANGQISRNMKYLSGEPDSVYNVYYSNGKLAEDNYFLFGNLHGIIKDYYPEGRLKIISNYLNDELNGEYIKYYSNGQIQKKEKYLNGKKHGLAVYYAENGKLIKRLHYYNDEIIKAEYM